MPNDVQIDGSIIEINGNTYNAKTINSIHIEPHPNPKALTINRKILIARIWVAMLILLVVGDMVWQCFAFYDVARNWGIRGYFEFVLLLNEGRLPAILFVHLPNAFTAFCIYMIFRLGNKVRGNVLTVAKLEPYASIHFTMSNRKKVLVFAALEGECQEIYKKLKQTINH